LAVVRSVGMKVCCGGILGMGESEDDRIGLIQQLAMQDPYPESVPINTLIPVEGTPLADTPPLPWTELLRAVAVCRILMPKSMVRLSAGRSGMSEESQALCFLAGANSIFLGDQLLTAPNRSKNADVELFDKLGLEGINEIESVEAIEV
jgi:biotin synthase